MEEKGIVVFRSPTARAEAPPPRQWAVDSRQRRGTTDKLRWCLGAACCPLPTAEVEHRRSLARNRKTRDGPALFRRTTRPAPVSDTVST
ncbi:unnamed protein product [Boreogadus saida]